jgi:hypothetical protein
LSRKKYFFFSKNDFEILQAVKLSLGGGSKQHITPMFSLFFQGKNMEKRLGRRKLPNTVVGQSVS